MSSATEREELPPFLLLFDGECAVCDRTVQFLLDRDPTGKLSFAPLQGSTAQAVKARHPEWPDDLDSLVLVIQRPEGEQLLFYSTAVLRAVGELGGVLGALCRAILLLPRILRDPLYRAFARIRYRVFGKVEACRLPRPGEAERFYA
mgnify:CR=1 FL=1